MKQRLLILLTIFCCLLAACGGRASEESAGEEPAGTQPPRQTESLSQAATAPDPTDKPADPRQEAIDDLLAQMTLEEKVGQMFFVRCPAAGAVEDIREYHLGGYLLFGRDFQDGAGNWLTAEAFTATVAAYQDAAKIPLLIGVDEEGGTVARASRNPNLFAEKRRSPQQVYAQGGMGAIVQDTFGYNRGLLLYGVNVNFAPVADVSADPADFIYDRAFGQDAEATAAYIGAAVSAMAECGIGPVLKHFPGYGNNADTHTGVALDQRPYEQFVTEDFLPFKAGIDAGAGAVMVSHNIVSSMDAQLPASMSPEVHRILREELGFAGVILTDDLAMGAIEAYAEDGSAAVLAVLSGNDMVVTTDYQSQIPQVIAAVADGAISEEMLNHAVSRVLGWKYDLGLLGAGE